jgi:uncharacterized protein
VRFACHGGFPKDRFTTTPDGRGRAQLPLPLIQAVLPPRTAADAHDGRTARRRSRPRKDHGQLPRRRRPPGPNDPCTCGSGRKWKHCHG